MKTIIMRLTLCGFISLLAACGNSEQATPVDTAAQMSATATETATAVVTCDRDCLIDYVDQYVGALVAHDPSQAPFAEDAKFTENSVVLELGDALWGTASAPPGNYQLKFADTTTNNVAFYLMMEESGSPIWLSGRLHVDNGEIDELETVVIRQGVSFSGFDWDTPDPEWNAIVPPEQRNSRAELFAIADGYAEALQENLVDFVEFDESCNRIENGVITANDPNATAGMGASTCQENINSGMWVYITDISPRRSLVVDEEKGIAMAMFMFHQDGSHEYAMVNGERVEYSGATRRPFTTVIPEMFKIRDGKIYRIWATMATIPYKSKSGW